MGRVLAIVVDGHFEHFAVDNGLGVLDLAEDSELLCRLRTRSVDQEIVGFVFDAVPLEVLPWWNKSISFVLGSI